MALDGLCIHALVDELNDSICGGKINKIAQPEKEELLITINTPAGNKRLLISANASLPFLYITEENKPAPLTAPGFCMLLRKHVGAARIIAIEQLGLERVVKFTLQHLNELGDITYKYLYVEIMGKHSNIIFCNDQNMILDAIKHIPSSVSSVREVLPGRDYFVPVQEGKISPLEVNYDQFVNTVLKKPTSLQKALVSSYTGFSPVIANEICYRASLDADVATASLFDEHKIRLFNAFENIIKNLSSKEYCPNIVIDNKSGEPIEFYPFKLTMYMDMNVEEYDTISAILVRYYARKNQFTNIRQRSIDLRKIISNHIDRSRKKYDLQLKQFKDTEKKDKYRVYGEMLHTYGYEAKPGDKSITVLNYYTNEELQIPLDPTLSASENAKKYFDKYSKLKRTAEALDIYLKQTEGELELLKSIEVSLNLAESEADLNDVRSLLSDYGFIKKNNTGKKQQKTQKNKPLHFIDDNGFHIYVGKNNYQNDELTFKVATGNDWWFHIKKQPGSHVIIKTEGAELPDSSYEYAAEVAAYYSSARDNDKVEIDYLQKKNVKKPAGAAAGFVVYYTNFSLIVSPTLEHVKLL